MADVVASERIFEDMPIPRSTRTRRILRYAPGAVIPEARAKALNVGKNGRQKKVPTAKFDETGAIPLTRGEIR